MTPRWKLTKTALPPLLTWVTAVRRVLSEARDLKKIKIRTSCKMAFRDSRHLPHLPCDSSARSGSPRLLGPPTRLGFRLEPLQGGRASEGSTGLRGTELGHSPARRPEGPTDPGAGSRRSGGPTPRAGTRPAASPPPALPPSGPPTCRREKSAVPGCRTREPQRWHSTAFRFRPSADTSSFGGASGSIAAATRASGPRSRRCGPGSLFSDCAGAAQRGRGADGHALLRRRPLPTR